MWPTGGQVQSFTTFMFAPLVSYGSVITGSNSKMQSDTWCKEDIMQPLLSHDSESSVNSENDSTNDLHSYAINNMQYSYC